MIEKVEQNLQSDKLSAKESYDKALQDYMDYLTSVFQGKPVSNQRQKEWKRVADNSIARYGKDSIYDALPQKLDSGYLTVVTTINFLARKKDIKTKSDLVNHNLLDIVATEGFGDKRLEFLYILRAYCIAEENLNSTGDDRKVFEDQTDSSYRVIWGKQNKHDPRSVEDQDINSKKERKTTKEYWSPNDYINYLKNISKDNKELLDYTHYPKVIDPGKGFQTSIEKLGSRLSVAVRDLYPFFGIADQSEELVTIYADSSMKRSQYLRRERQDCLNGKKLKVEKFNLLGDVVARYAGIITRRRVENNLPFNIDDFYRFLSDDTHEVMKLIVRDNDYLLALRSKQTPKYSYEELRQNFDHSKWLRKYIAGSPTMFGSYESLSSQDKWQVCIELANEYKIALYKSDNKGRLVRIGI